MPTPVTEFLNGGLVTARHPALLAPGELQRADDCVYRDKDTSIQRAPGRTVYNSSALASGIKGLAYLSFDSNTDQLLAWVDGDTTNSYLYKSPYTTITGSFTILTGPGTVASCVLNGTTTITAPSGSFTNMVIGAKVAGTGIATGTIVTAVNSDTNITVSIDATAGTVTLTFDAGIAYALPDSSTGVLDSIQWQDTYFLLPKNGPVTRVGFREFATSGSTSTLVARRAGLLPVTQAPVVSTETGAGWSSVLGNGYYWFLITEMIYTDNPNIPDVESGYLANGGKAEVTQISAYATQYIRITFPTQLANDGANGTNRATHWGIYMSVIGPGAAAYADNTNMPSAATFRRVAVVPVEETSKDIKYTNTFQFKYPTAETTGGGIPAFTNASGMRAPGGTYAQGVSGGANTMQSIETTFGFDTGSPYSGYTVTGIEVFVVARTGYLSGKAGYYLGLDNNSTKVSNWSELIVKDSSSFSLKITGSQFDRWGVSWVPADIGNLRVKILKSYTSGLQTLEVDYIAVKVHYSGAAVSTGSLNLDGPPYQVVTYRSQIGTTVSDPVNYIIPSATTGDIFSGSLVLNDILNPSLIRYSLAGAPESFPKPYEMKFNSRKKDIVTCIRRVGQILVVGMRDSIKRVNYLPTEADVDFGRGLAHEDIVTDHGIVGPHAATLCDITGTGVVLVYAAYNGFYYTDGITSRPLNLDIKIGDLVNSATLGTAVLRAYPKEKWLVFYYCPNGASHTKNTRAIVFHYSPDKIKEGGYLPALGPLTISGRAAAETLISGVSYLLTAHDSNGKVYVEDSGTTQASGYQVHNSVGTLADAPIQPLIRTRRIYPSGFERDAREQRIYVLHDALGSASVTATSNTTDGSTTVTSSAAFGSVVKGMLVTGTGIQPGTVVTNVATTSSITISAAAEETNTGITLTFDTGAISLTMRGSGIDEAVQTFDTFYYSTTVGDLLVSHHDNVKQGLELQIEKVVLPDSSSADLGVAMRLHNFTYLVEDAGTESNRRT